MKCPTRGCRSTRFWRLVDAAGRPLYPEAAPVCALCRPPQPGAARAVELLDLGTVDDGRPPALEAGPPGFDSRRPDQDAEIP